MTDDELTAFLRRTEDAASAWMRGDMERYLALTKHAPGFTLVAPNGGPPTRHEDRHSELHRSRATSEAARRRSSTSRRTAWGDTLVVVMIERQHGEVGDLPDQDWSLRVTQVYRREGADWLLVHRHADPLVATVDLAGLSALMSRD